MDATNIVLALAEGELLILALVIICGIDQVNSVLKQ